MENNKINLSESARYSILSSLPNTERQYLHGARVQEITITLCGQMLASKCRVFKRGKEVSTHYYITERGVTLSNP